MFLKQTTTRSLPSEFSVDCENVAHSGVLFGVGEQRKIDDISRAFCVCMPPAVLNIQLSGGCKHNHRACSANLACFTKGLWITLFHKVGLAHARSTPFVTPFASVDHRLPMCPESENRNNFEPSHHVRELYGVFSQLSWMTSFPRPRAPGSRATQPGSS